MSLRELVVLGTASQAPTRERNHNGYLLRWDGEGFLFDPGEGTQRQMVHAGVSAGDITRICVTHFHGDHCLGVPGLVQRLSLDRVPHPVVAHYPASGADFFARLRRASAFHETADVRERPGRRARSWSRRSPFGTLQAPAARPPASRRSVTGSRSRTGGGCSPTGSQPKGSPGPTWAGCSARAGSRSTAGSWCWTTSARCGTASGSPSSWTPASAPPSSTLPHDADLLVIESTFLDADADLAAAYGHLTAGQAARVAAEAGVRRLVLTHFSQRYENPDDFAAEAARWFGGEVVVAADLLRVPVPRR